MATRRGFKIGGGMKCSSNQTRAMVPTSFDEGRYFSQILSDNDILDLHEICMTVGFHYINTKTVAHGRFLLESTIGSLRYYRKAALLSTVALESDSFFFPIYDVLTTTISDEDLDTYLIHFDADILCIENTKMLGELAWLRFIHGLQEYKYAQKIPILMISYQ